MKEKISIPEMLLIMEEGEIFSMTVCSFDKNRKKGGQIIEFYEAVLLSEKNEAKEGNKKITSHLKRPLSNKEIIKPKKPNHYQHYTRNIRLLTDGHPTSIIKKIHIPLVVEFNGLEVVP